MNNIIRTIVVSIIISTFHLRGDTLISASDERINYYGRFDFSNPSTPTFNWSGSTIEANLPGPYIGINLVDGYADYDVEIDGELDTVIRTDTTKKYIIKTNLSEGYHIVRIIQRSENHYNKAFFRGFYIANGKRIGSPPKRPIRKIEFIGDSYTAGYGIESSSISCNQAQVRMFTNVNLTFATLVSKAFHSQSIILGWSGAGVVRNYRDTLKRSKRPFPYYYDKTLGEADTNKIWDFSKWIPDLVVICLGTNDFSTSPHPDDSMFIGDYHKFISTIRKNYINVPVLCVATDESDLQKLIQKIVEEEKSIYKRDKIFFAKFPPIEKTSCDWHPSINDNKKIAKVLIDTIMKKLERDTSLISAITVDKYFSNDKNNYSIERLSILKLHSSIPFYFVDLKGERIIFLGRKGNFVGKELSHNGILLAGNNLYGWRKRGINIR